MFRLYKPIFWICIDDLPSYKMLYTHWNRYLLLSPAIELQAQHGHIHNLTRTVGLRLATARSDDCVPEHGHTTRMDTRLFWYIIYTYIMIVG